MTEIEKLFDDSAGVDIAQRMRIIASLGSLINESDSERFMDLLREGLDSNLDVTGWTRSAIKAFLLVCSENNMPATIKHGTRTIVLAQNLKGGMVESFVNFIITGK